MPLAGTGILFSKDMIITPPDVQTTSTNANNQYTMQRPWDDHMPLTNAFTVTFQAKVASWATGGGIDTHQSIMTVNCSDECIQIYALADGISNTIWTWQGEASIDPPIITELYSVPNYSGWALYAIRNNGLGGLTEIVIIPDGGAPIVLNAAGDFGKLRQLYIQGIFDEQCNQMYGSTVIIYEEYLNNAALLLQAASDSPLPGKVLNTFYPMDDATTSYIDQSGHGYDAQRFNTASTVNDSPYI